MNANKKISNGKKAVLKTTIFPQENLKKIKKSTDERLDNKKILSKILADFTLSEKDNPANSRPIKFEKATNESSIQALPSKLPEQINGKRNFKEFSLVPTNQNMDLNQQISNFNLSNQKAINSLLIPEPQSKNKIKFLPKHSINSKHSSIKKGLDNQLKKWKKLFSKKQEIESKLASHKANMTLGNIKNICQINTNNDRVKKKYDKKDKSNRGKLTKMNRNDVMVQETKVVDTKKEQFEIQLKEEKKINNLIFNKSSKKLDLRMIQHRHEKILNEKPRETENKITKPPLLKENGHFNWDYLEDEYYNQKYLNNEEIHKLDKKLLKKVYCEFLLMNENQLKEKSIKNFLAEYLKKRHIANGRSFDWVN